MKLDKIIINLREYDDPLLQEAANLLTAIQPRPIEEAPRDGTRLLLTNCMNEFHLDIFLNDSDFADTMAKLNKNAMPYDQFIDLDALVKRTPEAITALMENGE